MRHRGAAPSRRRHVRLATLAVSAIIVTACGGDLAPNPSTTRMPDVSVPQSDLPNTVPSLDSAAVAHGAEIYSAYCAACHGADLAGAEDWKTRNADGSFKPPPQDSSGHTWHHSDQLLIDLISNGVEFPESRMPTFGDVLTASEIRAVLEFFKSNWADEERAFQWEMTQRDASQ